MSEIVPTVTETPEGFWKWFLGHLSANKIVILTVVFGTGVIIFIRGLIPIMLGHALDTAVIDITNALTDEEQLALLKKYVVTILLLGITQFAISVITTIANEWLAWSAQRRIREEFFNSMQNKPLKFHDSVRTGEIMALATNDLGQVGGMISPGFGMMSDVFISVLLSVFLVLEVMKAPILILLSIPFFVAYVWAVFSYNKKMAPISYTFMRKWGAIATAVQDNIAGAEVVRAFAEESYERQKFMRYVLDFRETWYSRQIIQAKYYPTLVLFAAIGTSVFIGSFFVADGLLSIGNLVAFNGLLFTLLGPTYVISFAVSIFNGGLAGARRIYSMERREEGEDNNGGEKIKLERLQGKITFEHVSFKYPTSKKWILEDISFTIAPGQTIAIVGPTGSGKSSLTKLLLRLYDYEGTIKIDNVDIKDISLESLRKCIGRIEQDIYLFPRSVKENIAFGARNASQGQLVRAAKMAQAHNFIVNDLAEGYETNVGEGGSNLSGGQKQRIALARTFLTDPKILILDDSTSSVDSKTEEEIVKAIKTVSQGRTTFIITHRLSTIRSADCIFVIKGSKIVAKGHHSKLIHTSKDYRRIFGKNVQLPPLKSAGTGMATGGLN
ncbi:MAG: ABC transporter ATP-binding protein [Candidatus Hodarchaeales archaeon]